MTENIFFANLFEWNWKWYQAIKNSTVKFNNMKTNRLYGHNIWKSWEFFFTISLECMRNLYKVIKKPSVEHVKFIRMYAHNTWKLKNLEFAFIYLLAVRCKWLKVNCFSKWNRKFMWNFVKIYFAFIFKPFSKTFFQKFIRYFQTDGYLHCLDW